MIDTTSLPAAGVTLLRGDLHAPATASMRFDGPLIKESQPLRGLPPTHEYQRHDFLASGAVYARSTAERRAGVSGGDLAGGVAGDGSKFSQGFFRGRTDWRGAHAAADEAGCARSYARDALRAQFLSSNVRRTGYNVITGQEEGGPALDCYKPRGRVALQDSAGPLRAVENVTRDCEPGVRMHRVEEAGGARAQARAATLHREGLTATARHSSELGFGRRSLPSAGVGEALAGAAYGGLRAAQPADYAAATVRAAAGGSSSSAGGAPADLPLHLIKSGVVGRGVWDVRGGMAAGNEEEQWRLSLLVGQRARNRVFDTDSAPIIASAVGDAFVREARESRELQATRPPRPQQRPASFTATARALNGMRATAERRAEALAVANLQF